MNLDNYLHNPTIGFEYISEKEVWNNVFKNPFPKDLNNILKGYINLYDYFRVEECIREKKNGVDRGTLVTPKNRYFEASEEERSLAFCAFFDFLKRFNLCFFFEIFVDLPKHSDVETVEEYHPAQIVFSPPGILEINEERNKFVVELEEGTFDEYFRYMFNGVWGEKSGKCNFTWRFLLGILRG